jgi:virginiamycin B lyase
MTNLHQVQHPVSSLKMRAKISIPGSPDWVAIDDHAVWISNQSQNTLERIDPSRNERVATIPVSRSPCSGLAVGFGSIWSPSCQDGRVDRVDAATNAVISRISAPVADSEGAIAAGTDAVWMMTDKNGTLSKIDPGGNRIIANIQIDPGSFAVAAEPDAIWITSTANNLLVRVSPHTLRVVARIPTGPSPRFLCTGEDSVWVLNQGDGTVTRIDSNSNQVAATIKVGDGGPGGDIASGQGAVWVTAVNVPLTRIDPKMNRVTSQFIGPGGDAIRLGHGALWMCSFLLQELWRVDPPIA